MAQLISKVHYIVHPAFSVASFDWIERDYEKSPPAAVQHWIEKELLPEIRTAMQKPDELVVLVKSPPEDLPKKGARGYSPARIRKQIAIEKKLEQTLKAMGFGNRLIVPETTVYENTNARDEAFVMAEEVKKIVKQRGFGFDNGFRIMGYGTWGDRCVRTHVDEFGRQNRGNYRGRVILTPFYAHRRRDQYFRYLDKQREVNKSLQNQREQLQRKSRVHAKKPG